VGEEPITGCSPGLPSGSYEFIDETLDQSLHKFKSGFRERAVLIVLLIALPIAVFHGVTACSFLNYDDPEYVTHNGHVQSGLSIQTFAWAFSSTQTANWHPLTWLSHSLDCSLFGLVPEYHHLVNLALHILSVLLLFFALERMTGSLYRSAFVAVVFALHPLHVESVAWIAERKDVLSGVFWMLTLLAYARFHESGKKIWYGASFGFFLLGLIAKPMLVTLPFVLILLDFWPLRRIPSAGRGFLPGLRKSIIGKIPFFVLAAVFSVVTIIVQKAGGATSGLAPLSLTERLANALVSYMQYLRMTIVPSGLAVFYPHPAFGTSAPQVVAPLVVLVVISVLVWKARTRHPAAAVGWLWFLGTLVPVIGIVQVGLQSMADRYMYIPMIGLSIMVAWLAPDFVPSGQLKKVFLAAASVIIVCLMSAATLAQVDYWKDSRSLFEHAVATTEGNFIALNNLASALADSGLHREAVADLEACLRIQPNYPPAHQNLARSYLAMGKREEAIQEYFWQLNHGNNDPSLREFVGDLLAEQGRMSEAVTQFRNALAADPENMRLHSRLAEVYARQKNFDQALAECRRVQTVEPHNSSIAVVLGMIAGMQNRNDEAMQHFTDALRWDSTNASAYLNLGILCNRLGEDTNALSSFGSAVRWNPSNALAQFNYGTALARTNRLPEAAIHWEKAVALDARSLDARLNLGRYFAMFGKPDSALMEIQDILLIDSQNLGARYLRAGILERSGRMGEAKSEYQAILRISPTEETAQRALGRLK